MHWLVIVGDEGEWKHNGYDVGKEVLYRCRIETREGNWRGKTVMELMVASVEPGMVKEPVDVVCQDLACQIAIYEMSHRFLERGQSG